jgi:ABC-type Fe3+ transport system permease subunit/DNA-binding beta-propeller fold protein YncE
MIQTLTTLPNHAAHRNAPTPVGRADAPENSAARSSDFTLSLPVLIVVCLSAGLPLAWLLWQILSNPQVLSESRPDAFRLALLGRTLLYNGAVAIVATLLGIPAALVLGRGRGIVQRVLFFALPVSLLLPSITYAYGWSQFLRLIGAYPEPAAASDVFRCIWSLATWLWPIPAAAIALALRRLDTQVQQQALLDGALWRITFRQVAPMIAASAAIVAVLAVQEFSVYEPTGISVVATEVRMVFETGAFSSPDNPITAAIAGQSTLLGASDQRARAGAAVAAALPLLLVIALAAVAVLLVIRRTASEEQVDTGPWPRALDAGWMAKSGSLFVVFIAVIIPTASLVLSLKRALNPIALWDEFAPQIMGSLSMAALAGAFGLALAFWTTVHKSLLSLTLTLAAFLVGGQLLAIALIRLYNRPALSWAYNGPPILIAVYLARFSWIALLAGQTSWSKSWKTLRDLASLDGAGGIRTATSVVWPLAWPVLLASAILVMALSLVEVPATVLISPQRPQMLTPLMMTWVHMLRYDSMIEASLLLMATVAVLGILAAGLFGFASSRLRLRGAVASLLLVLLLVGCDRASKPEAVWLSTGTGPDQTVYPRAITYSRSDDTFFVIDRVARIQHLDNQGNYLNEWRMPEWSQGKPVGVTVGPDGNVYVPDTHYHRVMVYSPKGELIRHWGSKGTEPGQFIYPTDIAFDSKQNVFVSEYGDNDRIQVFDPSGKFLYAFGHFGQADGDFSRPQSMLIDHDILYVTDACNHRISVFNTDGTFIRNMGSVGSGPGQFRFPYGLDQDKYGNLIVCEFGNNRVQLIDRKTGKGLATWGVGGHDPGQLAYPWGVAVDKRNRVVAVDAGNNRLQVFDF